MIDFTNKSIIKLKPMENSEGENEVKDILIPDETVTFAFVSMRDKLIFTDKRIISVNVKGITGKKIDYTSIPYANIQAFSIESAGTIDFDSELDITISGLGTVRFELSNKTDIRKLGQSISGYVLDFEKRHV